MTSQVIEILSDDQEVRVNQKKKDKILQRLIQDKAALLKSPVGIMLAVSMETIRGTTQEKQQLLMERIHKMFLQKEKMDIRSEHFCLRRQPNLAKDNNNVVLDQIVIFGCDFWSTKQIKNEAKALKIQLDAIKIDNSHTKLIFKDFNTSKKWLQCYLKQKSILKTKLQQDGMQSEEMQNSKEQNALKGWFDLEDYKFQGFTRIRQARFCMGDEKDIQALREDVKQTKYQKFKKIIEEQFKTNDLLSRVQYQNIPKRSFNHSKFKGRQDQYKFDKKSCYKKYREKFPNEIEEQRRRDRRNQSRQFRNISRSRNKRQHRYQYSDNDIERYRQTEQYNYKRSDRRFIKQNEFQKHNKTSYQRQKSNYINQTQNFSQLLDKVNNDNQNGDNMDISMAVQKQMNNMNIQDQPNMSIDLMQQNEPEGESKNKSHDMSILQQQKDKYEHKTHDKTSKTPEAFINSKIPNQKSEDNKLKQKARQSFDYYKYIQDQEKRQSLVNQSVYRTKN